MDGQTKNALDSSYKNPASLVIFRQNNRTNAIKLFLQLKRLPKCDKSWQPMNRGRVLEGSDVARKVKEIANFSTFLCINLLLPA